MLDFFVFKKKICWIFFFRRKICWILVVLIGVIYLFIVIMNYEEGIYNSLFFSTLIFV